MYNFFMNIILASASPRRKEILSDAGYTFEVVPSCYDENICNCTYTKELVEDCAAKKALEVNEKLKGVNLIVSADTVVVLENRILGKPKDENESFDMLKKLSGNTHFVATSVCLIYNNSLFKNTEITYVTFRNLTDLEIKNYILKFKPYDKAGSYGIQDKGFDFATDINGNLDNVIGFPLKTFESLLKKLPSVDKWRK